MPSHTGLLYRLCAKLYIERKSLSLDMQCIFRTVQLIFQIVVLKKKKFELTEYEKEATARVFPSK